MPATAAHGATGDTAGMTSVRSADDAPAHSTTTVYGAPWCPDCRRAKQFLNEQRVPSRWVDIDADDAARARVEVLQGGGRIIPTSVFPEGDHLLEPSNAELAARLGLKLTASRSAYDLVIIGTGPADLSAAMFAAREGIEVGTAAGEGIAALFAIRAALEASHLARRARYDEPELHERTGVAA